MDKTKKIPYLENEIKDILIKDGFKEKDVEIALQLQNQFKLINILQKGKSSEKIISNEYIWGSNHEKIALAVSNLDMENRNELGDIISVIQNSQGYPIEKINKTHKYGDEIKINKGDLLEYQIKRLLFNMGYFCKIGVIVRTSDSTDAEDVTDLDVFGIAIQKDFTYKSIWADCKAGKAKPLERISWINGIKNFIGIDDAIFVKKNVRINTKIFAQKSNIQILYTKELNKLSNTFVCISNIKNMQKHILFLRK